jgi:putative Mg2+ transporter-C (MgtC) family protein
MEIREVTYLAVALRVVAAVIIGGLIGLERGMKNRAAGMRTYMTVCLGACLIMLTNQYIFQVYGAGDPVRMGAQVVSGIGFLGAGTIVVTRRSQIKGLTTAAGLWASAGVGLALGIGFYEAALAGGLAVVIVMTALQGLDNRMHQKTKSVGVYFELNRETTLGDFLRIAQEKGMDIRDVIRESSSETGNRAYIATVKLEKRKNHHDICDDVREIPGVEYLEDL